MKRIILIVLCLIASISIYAQLKTSEKQAIDSLLKTRKISISQANTLLYKYRNLDYPEFNINSYSGEIEISDTLSVDLPDKKIIYQRCLEWIAINYANLVHSDLESGKIIAHGQLILSHFEESSSGLGYKNVRPASTSTDYTLILTLKENRIRYLVTNINFNFKIVSEYVDIVSSPMPAIYPSKTFGQEWLRYFTVLNASSEMFNNTLKESLVHYINEAKSDYRF